MKTKKVQLNTWSLVALVSFFFFPPFHVQSQEKVYVPYIEVINMNPVYQYSTSRLLKTYMEDFKRYTVVLPLKVDSLYPPEPLDSSRVKAKALGATYFIIGEMNRVGESVLISLSLYSVADGNKLWNDKLKANSPDDIDPIIQRFAKNIGTQNKAAKEEDIYAVTDQESKELKKTHSNSYIGVGIGSLFPFSSLSLKPMTGGELMWSYDTRKLLIEIKGQAYWWNRSSVYDFSLETYFPFRSSTQTPFFGGGIGISGVNNNDPSRSDMLYSYDRYHGAGLMLLAGGGYIFNRTSDVQVRLSGNGFIGLYQVVNQNPAGVLLKMEILFQKR